ncbi:MAG: multicopper oxidase domain-containing protein [Cytophagales bacterium]|nr:multicopper oxidase domain-containing protein [Cytophagales bacterium]
MLAVSFMMYGLFILGCNKKKEDSPSPNNPSTQLFTTPLKRPATVKGTSASFTASSTFAEVVPGSNTGFLAYNNSVPGPTISINSGQTLNINFLNSLSEGTNIHWHGLDVPANQDGFPTAKIGSGANYNFSFPVNNRAGAYWYHPHPEGATASQAYKGMAGFFIVRDAEETALNLPSGDYEVPIVIQDKKLDGNTQLIYNPTANDIMTGWLGDKIVVNGVYAPYLSVATRFYRFRVLNGSNARIYNLALSNGADFYVIGSDGGLLSTPATIKNLMLSPGERADILINFNSYSLGTEIYLQSNSFTSMSQGNEFKIMKFKVDKNEAETFSLPSSLSVINTLSPTSADTTRSFVLKANPMGSMPGMSGMHTINDKIFDANRVDETVKAGATEVWEIENTSDEPHPMHIHGGQFLVLQRTGGRNTLIATEYGWKDTALLMPGEKIKIIMKFSSNIGKFVFHCHNLEHEEDGMMLVFEIL